MTLADATAAYQAQLEHARAAWNAGEISLAEELEEDVAKARAAMETAWLNEKVRLP